MSEIVPMIEDAIKDGGEFRLVTAGTSMLPMLGDRTDTVVLRKAEGKLKKYDLPLYKRADGSFVLHRVIGIGRDGYRTSGDSQTAEEYPVTDEQIIAVTSAYIKNGKTISTDSFGYRIYCRWQCGVIRPLRRLIKGVRR